MNTTLITIISSFVFLILLWIGVGVRYLKNSRKTLNAAWEFVDEKIRKRHDYAPVLVECVRVNGTSGGADAGLSALVEKMVPLRDSARRIYFPGADKTEKEIAFGRILTEMVSYGEKTDANKDTYFLEVKKEISDINSDISGRAKDYNEQAETYNKSLNNLFLKPLAFVLKSRKAEIFNF